VGNSFGLGLYAAWDGQQNQSFSAVDAIIGWNPAYLRMLSLSNTGGVPLLSSVFPAHDAYQLNEVVPPQDGDGLYQALTFLGSPVTAPFNGALLTTLRFHALSQTTLTSVAFLPSAGSPTGYTRVYDGVVPNLDITGTLTGASVTIIPEPASYLLLLIAGALLLPTYRFVWSASGGTRSSFADFRPVRREPRRAFPDGQPPLQHVANGCHSGLTCLG